MSQSQYNQDGKVSGAMSLARMTPFVQQYEEILQRARLDIRIEYIPSLDDFIRVYQAEIPKLAGAYVFHLADDIIYVGKALNFARRIWHHLQAPQPHPDLQNQLGFSGSRFLNDVRISEEVRSKIFLGQFKIDYFAINVEALADCLEVYIQGVYFAETGRLPIGNLQFG